MQFVRGETLKLYAIRQERLFAIEGILKSGLGFFRNRYLELADVALGLKEPILKNR
jgi:hypothetical protein